MTPALPHRWRLWALVIVTLLDIVALAASHLGVAPELLGELRPLVETSLAAVLLVLVPGLADAYLVERRRRTPGVPALPDDAVLEEARGWPEPPTRPDRPSRLPPAGLGLVLVVLAAALSAPTSGCGATPIEVHAQIAGAAQDAAAETRTLVRRYRSHAMEAAARAVHDAGGDEEAAKAAAEARGKELAPLIAAQRVYARAAYAYIEALDLAAGDPDAPPVLAERRKLLEAYRELRRAGAQHGLRELAALPPVPTWLPAPVEAQEGGGS